MAVTVLQAPHKEATRLAGVREGGYRKQKYFYELYWLFVVVVSRWCFVVQKVYNCVFLWASAMVYNKPVSMHMLHVSLLLDFTAAAAADELRSRRQQHASSAAATEAALQARREQRVRLLIAGVYEGGYRKQKTSSSKFTSNSVFGCFITFNFCWCFLSLKKNLNASKSFEHPQDRVKNVKTFGWDHRLQRLVAPGNHGGGVMQEKRTNVVFNV